MPKRAALWVLLLAAVLTAVAMVFIPVWLIQPFKRQTPGALEWSYLLRRSSPLVTALVAVGAAALAVWLWRGGRWWSRTAVVLLTFVACGTAWAARQNHFEWMFKPLPEDVYTSANEAGFVAATDLVMGVEINGQATAYPVRQMAYHHIVNDEVGGRPVVATY